MTASTTPTPDPSWHVHPGLTGSGDCDPDFCVRRSSRKSMAVVAFQTPLRDLGDATAQDLARRLVETARAKPANPQTAQAITDLQGQQAELQGLLRTCRARQEDLAAEQGSLDLLRSKNPGNRLLQIDKELELLQRQDRETAASLQTVENRLRQIQAQRRAEFWALIDQAAGPSYAVAVERRRALLLELAAAAGPILDKLVQAEAELAALSQRSWIPHAEALVQASAEAAA